MYEKRYKVKGGLSGYIPVSINFSELEKKTVESEKNEDRKVDYGDGGLFSENLEQSFEYEKLVLTMLTNLPLKEKLVFVFQLMRDMGYQIDHGSFSRTISLPRLKYMKMLKTVRKKTNYLVHEYSTGVAQTKIK